MHVSLLSATTFLLMVVAFRSTDAHANGLGADVCATFGVEHSGSRRNDTSKIVRLMLLNESGHEQHCFQPKTNYWVKLNATSLIRGFLLQATEGARLPASNNINLLPDGVTRGPCTSSVSHTQVRTSRSSDLKFQITVKKSTKPMRFRYTVVFSPSSYLENQWKEFPCCQQAGAGEITTQPPTTQAPTTTPTSPTTQSTNTNQVPNISGSGLGTPVNTTCGKNITYTVKSINDTRNGIRYNCTINKPLKGTICVETCESEGEQLQCYINRHIPRRKGYQCVPYTDGDQANTTAPSYTRTFDEIVTTGCKCYSVEQTSTSGASES